MSPAVVFCKDISQVLMFLFMYYFTTCWGVILILINQADSPVPHLSSAPRKGEEEMEDKVPILWI